jgi:hypothetical protein
MLPNPIQDRQMRRLLPIAYLCVLLPFTTPPALAQDAAFGCKVLLCAAASAPGWSGIPYCVPVMQSLFKQLAKGRGWPVCSEGSASGLGHEPWQPCQSGLPYKVTQTAASNGANGNAPGSQIIYVADANGGVCMEPSLSGNAACLIAAAEQGGNSQCAAIPANYVPAERGARQNPWFVEITPKNSGTSRFYFSLNGQ